MAWLHDFVVYIWNPGRSYFPSSNSRIIIESYHCGESLSTPCVSYNTVLSTSCVFYTWFILHLKLKRCKIHFVWDTPKKEFLYSFFIIISEPNPKMRVALRLTLICYPFTLNKCALYVDSDTFSTYLRERFEFKSSSKKILHLFAFVDKE